MKRFIYPCARFLGLEHPVDCPAHALGFDFDEATVTHVGHRVTFETQADSFALARPASGPLPRSCSLGSAKIFWMMMPC